MLRKVGERFCLAKQKLAFKLLNKIEHGMIQTEQKPKFITRKVLADRWALSYMTIRRREKTCHLTPRKLLGATIRYSMDEVLAVEALG